MKAVVYEGPGTVDVKEVADPKIEKPNDTIIRLTTTAIRGSDLHMYDGHTPAKGGMILGHELLGVSFECHGREPRCNGQAGLGGRRV